VKTLALLLLLAPAARAADVPFYLRTLEDPRAAGSINENFRSVVGDLTKLRADLDALDAETTAADPVVQRATWTVLDVDPAATLPDAIAGSTVCFSTPVASAAIEMTFTASYIGTKGANLGCNFLLDGAYPGGYTGSKYIYWIATNNVGGGVSLDVPAAVNMYYASKSTVSFTCASVACTAPTQLRCSGSTRCEVYVRIDD
jgi:hypothetical protein